MKMFDKKNLTLEQVEHIDELDDLGFWNRDYSNMDIPFEELALPRNAREEYLYNMRIHEEFDPFVEMIHQLNKVDDRTQELNIRGLVQEMVLEDGYSLGKIHALLDSNESEWVQVIDEEYNKVVKSKSSEYQMSEKVRLRREKIEDLVEQRDIVYGFYRYSQSKDNGKDRPMLIYAMSDNNILRYIMITSIKDNTSMEFDIDISKWKESGLNKPSRVRINTIHSREDVHPKYILGSLSNIDAKNIYIGMKKYIGGINTIPVVLYTWLNVNKIPVVRDNNYNSPLMSIKDVVRVKTITSVDFAIICYKMNKMLKDVDECSIGYIKWKKNDKIIYRFFPIYKKKNKEYYVVLQYYSKGIGSIDRFFNRYSMKDCLRLVKNRLKTIEDGAIPKKANIEDMKILTKGQLDLLDNDYDSQAKLLDAWGIDVSSES